MSKTPLQQALLRYAPRGPRGLLKTPASLRPEEGPALPVEEELKTLFREIHSAGSISFHLDEKRRGSQPQKVGVFFSGGQAPGGHNVVAGLFDTLQRLSPASRLVGFIGGPSGLIEGNSLELDAAKMAPFINQGGFHLLGSGRTKFETEEQFEKIRAVVQQLSLDGLVIIGGDDSNTNGAYLAEDFAKRGIACTVIGVPKTIDGDLKGDGIELSFGFDTASKIYSETVGHLSLDLLSAQKMWAFVRLMGRSASHLTLETALNTHPNLALIGEAIEREGRRLKEIVEEIADLVVRRAKRGKNWGLLLLPEGIIEFIPEFKRLLEQLNASLARPGEKLSLDAEGQALFDLLPRAFQEQLLLERDPHGNLQVSKIETERLLIEMVKEELKKRGERLSFSPQPLFLGYEGRAASPTLFDADYSYCLGAVAALGVAAKAQGRMALLTSLHLPPEEWVPKLIPLFSLLHFEVRKGRRKAVIRKALVDLEGERYKLFLRESPAWAESDDYLSPGPIQYFGPDEVTRSLPWIVKLKE